MLEFLKLLWVRATTFFYEALEFIKVVFRFYPNKKFRQQDLSLLRSYLFLNPYRICKEYLIRQGEEDPYVYGETPLTTLAQIAKECKLNAQDVVYELGCGRGRSCFWLGAFVNCRVTGIEQIDIFVVKANQIKTKYTVENVRFSSGNFLEFNYKDATVIYLYGTCLEEATIMHLIKKFAKMAPGSKIITISYPLTDYLELQNWALFELVHTFQAPFVWGWADVYLHVRR